jgi:hypothetical protein
MPTLGELGMLREEPEWDPQDDGRMVNNKGFVFLVEFMYGCLIGKRSWKKGKYVRKASDQMTVSDEAFVLLVLDNYWDILNGEESADPKYTGKHSTTNRRNDGWSNEGITVYNHLQVFVKKNRSEVFALEVEEGVMNLLYEKERGVDARQKRDSTGIQESDYRHGSNGANKRRFEYLRERVNPMIDLELTVDKSGTTNQEPV